MLIYLVRHGQANEKHDDAQRHLSDTGRRTMERVAAFLKPLDLHVQVIWHSGKTRAAETAEILAQTVAATEGVQPRAGLKPNDPVKPVCDDLAYGNKDVAIVGHLPFLEKLACALVCGHTSGELVNLPTGGIVCLEGAGDAWHIRWVLHPEMLGASAA